VRFFGTAVNYVTRFWRKQGMIENFEYLGEFQKDFRKYW
jgi:hypothetical protein